MEHTTTGTRPRNRFNFLARLRQVVALHRQRQRLLDLDDHLLNDIGLTDADARAEAERPLWDVPRTWRR